MAGRGCMLAILDEVDGVEGLLVRYGVERAGAGFRRRFCRWRYSDEIRTLKRWPSAMMMTGLEVDDEGC
jgi:hypothetical protein